MALNARQSVFVREYAVGGNATEAALAAGYSPKRAHVTGSDLLHRPAVTQAIAAQRAAAQVRTDVSADRVLKRLAALSEQDDNLPAAVAATTTLAKRLGLLEPAREEDDGPAVVLVEPMSDEEWEETFGGGE